MAQKPVSLQDLIRSRQQSGFVGRVGQLAQYRENLGLSVDDERRGFLFNIHGDAGVGKTYLTRQLRQLATDNGALTAYVDETTDDPTAAMSAIAGQLAQAGYRLRGFEKRAEAYQRRRHELESDPKAPDDIASFLTKTAVTIGLAAARDIPVAGSLLTPVQPSGVADQVNRARVYVTRRLGDHADVRLLLSPADELTPVFVAELNRVAAGRPLALFVDTYERTGLVLDHWLRRLYDGDYGGLPPTLVITIAGQKPLDRNLWSDYRWVIVGIPLEPFSDAEARQFLNSKGVHDEDLIQVILSLSGRLPLLLATLAETQPGSVEDIGDIAGDAVERFLKWVGHRAQRRVAMAAALPRILNQDVLAEVTGTGEAYELFGWLCGLPFIDRREGSWAYHEIVRAQMLRLQLAQAPSEWKARQVALAQAHERWGLDATGDDAKGWSTPRWIDHARERAYHLLCANPDANLHEVLTSAVKAAEHSEIRARQWAKLIAEAGNDTSHHKMREWGRQLNDGIRDSDLTGYLTGLIENATLDNGTLSIALHQRARGHRLEGRHGDALADLSRAIELSSDQAPILASRGETYRLMERYDEALADLNRAIELSPADIAAITTRSLTYVLMKRYDEALADLNRAIELDPKDDWSIAERGDTYRKMERYDDALADLNRAIQLNPDQAWILASRGLLYGAMDLYDDALADLNRAIELDPDQAWILASRGETYRDMERYDDALADLNRAIELDPDQAWILASRGETYRLMERCDDALADSNRAIELDPKDDWAFATRGEAYLHMKRYDDALADFNRAIELDPEFGWALTERGATYRAMVRHEEALADFNRAIELRPGQALPITSRGLLYGAMDLYDEALADLNRAIELDSDQALTIASRGLAYQRLHRYDEALADFTRAIELNPEYDWAIAGRGWTYRLMHRYEEALADLNRAIELGPNDDTYAAQRAEILQLMGGCA